MTRVYLGDICEFINGGAWSDKEYVEDGIPVLKVTNCKTDSFSLEDIDYLPLSAANTYAQHRLCLHDVVIATVGSHPTLEKSAAGRAVIINDSVQGFYLNQNAVCLRSKSETVLNQRYLGYLARSFEFRNFIQMRGRGAANQMRIAIGSIKQFEFQLPDIHTQRRIADILSAYDDLIENNQKQIKLLEEAAQRLYREWFVELRFPGHESTPVVDGVPERWEYKLLSEVFDYVRGKSYTSKELSDATGVLMANLKNIRAFGGYNRNAEKRFTGQFKDNQTLTKGDIIMGVTDMTQERRLVGHVALVPDIGEELTFSMDLIKIIPKVTNALFIYSALHYGGISKKISPLANGVNVLHLKPEAMLGIKMLIPNDAIVRMYSQQVDPMMSRIDYLQKQCAIAVEARDRLLPKLMSGEVEV